MENLKKLNEEMSKVCGSALRRRVILGLVCLMSALSAYAERKPNIIYIFTDQQSATMMSCTGNNSLKTPAMDYLAANGVRFERAYCANPVCVPSRTAMITGRFPDTYGIRSNSNARGFRPMEGYAENHIGTQLKEGAGYDLAYGGKIHLPQELYPDKFGFEVISKSRKMDLSEDAVKYIKRDHDKPYYLVLSYINPHDICYYHRSDLKPHPAVEELKKQAATIPDFFESEVCPPLPPNFPPQPDEPEAYEAMKLIKLSNRETLTEEDWRLGRWVYRRLTESVDNEIQVVLDALKETGQEENTVVIFSSDHGENDATYKLSGKQTFNQESIRIPFIIMDKGGKQKAGTVDDRHLVSNGLDLLPTVLDYAGVPEAKCNSRGLSVRPLVEGKEVPWRKELGVESEFGRMVMDDRHKYIEYDMDGNIEVRLRDLLKDPYEKTHCTADPEYASDLVRMKEMFTRWFPHEATPIRNKNKRASAGNAFGQSIPLAGEWQMRVDADGVGVREEYFKDQFSGETGQLPGTHQDNLKGNNYKKKELGSFTHLSSFRGCIWYQKSVDIRDISKEYTLFMERCGWESNVWINGQYAGTQNSLVAPHEYTLTSYLHEGKNTITLMFDNANRKGIGHMPDEDEMILHYHLTQEVKKEAKLNCGGHQFKVHNWNGALGAVDLLVREEISIVKADVYSNIRESMVDVRVLIKNSGKAAGKIRLSAELDGIVKTVDHKLSGAPEETLTFAMPVSNPRLWSEYNPFLYTLKLQLGSQQHQVNFGMREISTEGVEMKLNGQRIFLRGTLECFHYPLQGHEPMDVAYWKKQISTAKEYGLNFFRFHSCCPPRAAFQAADEMGFYLQVEVPGTSCPSEKNEEKEATTRFLFDELKRIIYYFGNHPSFLLASMGNEQLVAGGQKEFIKRHKERLHIKVRYGQQTDPRHLYSAATHPWTEDREDDFFTSAWGTNRDNLCGVNWGGGVVKGCAPFNAEGIRFGTRYNYSDALTGLDRPLMTHESGQWCVYPDFREISRYHGATRFYNYEHFRKDLSDKGLLDYAADFTRASGKLALLLYKEEIEVVLRTPELSGFQLLQLQDYPGQGTSPVGIINSVWEPKGLTTPAEFRQFCSDFVPLARMDKMVWDSNESFGAQIELSNYSMEDFSGEISWFLQEDNGKIFAQGKLSDVLAPTGKLSKAGVVSVPLSAVAEAKSLRFIIQTSNGRVNGYELWFYPADNIVEVPGTVKVIHSWDEKAEKLLEKGAKVIYAPDSEEIKNSIPGTFSSVFWNSRMKHRQISKTMGLLIEPAHPALNDFPTQFHSNWQWQDIVNRSFSVDISSLSPAIRPAVRTIDTFMENKALAMIFEFSYKNGSVLVCTADITNELAKRPEARQLRKSLIDYVSSPLFNPDVPVSPREFQVFLGRDMQLENEGIK